MDEKETSGIWDEVGPVMEDVVTVEVGAVSAGAVTAGVSEVTASMTVL